MACSASRSLAGDRAVAVEPESAGLFAPAGLLADAEPDEDLAAVPAGALEALGDLDAGARHLFLVDIVAHGRLLFEALPQQRGAWPDPDRRLQVALDEARDAGPAKLD